MKRDDEAAGGEENKSIIKKVEEMVDDLPLAGGLVKPVLDPVLDKVDDLVG